MPPLFQAWLEQTPALMRAVFTALVLASSAIAAQAFAQMEISKLCAGVDQRPLGPVNTSGTTCVSLVYEEVVLTHDEACKEGWMIVGVGSCKKKRSPPNPLISHQTVSSKWGQRSPPLDSPTKAQMDAFHSQCF